jgi:predicted DNA binding CopG/RHH family protein
MSRPFLKNAKRANLVVRFQDEEVNAIKDYASKQDKPMSVLIRDVMLSHMKAEGVPTSILPEDPDQLKIETD